MKKMRTPRRWPALTRSFVALLALGPACADNDRTDVCLGPGCSNYEGIAGRNTLTAGNLGGFGGAGDAGAPPPEGPPDAAAPAPSDGGTSPPAAPCEVAFLSPLAADAGTTTLAAQDDVDGEACGRSFSARVLVLSNGSRVNLFVNDNPLGAVTVASGVARFDAGLGNRGSLGNTLRAEATMADGRHCSATLGESVFVACAGPSCSIDSPRANREGFLNGSDDDDTGTAGLQTDVVVISEAENVGRPVELHIDDVEGAIPAAVVVADAAEGSATFVGVTLAEGERSVRAECRDEFDIVTLSPPTLWNVDLESCSLEIESVAAGADPITPADDLDANPGNGLNVLVRGTVEGDACESIQVGACDADLDDIRLGGLLDEDGGFIVPIRLPAATSSVELCARVKDAAGNVSTPDVELTVAVRADSPRVAIVSPAPNTRVNGAGTAGAVADGNPASASSCELDVVVDCTDVGVAVELLADDEPLASAPCVEQAGGGEPFAGRATFAGVSLASHDDGSTTTLRARQRLPGLPEGLSSNVLVQADCNPPSCSFDGPDPNEPFLNAALDASGSTPGFQIDFVVATDTESQGSDVRLRLDGDASAELNAPATAGGAGVSATFTAVTLGEAEHDVQAFCTDAAGNVGPTPLASWTVDLSACSTSVVVAGGRDPIVPSDDLDGAAAGLQLAVTGQTSGAGCSAARVGPCGNVTGAFTDLAVDGSFALEATLPSAAANGVNVCAEVRDAAGNVASQSVSVNVRVDPPTVAFLLPAPNTTLNVDSGCTTSALVSCSEESAPVELFVDGSSRGTQPCTSGEASFNVTLPTKNDGSPSVLSAVQTAENVPSAPASVSVTADCEPPVLSVSSPACDSQLALGGDDVDDDAAGLQFDVNVLNGGVPNVVLTVLAGGSSDVQATGDESSTAFPAVTLGGVGNVSLLACATDAQGNQGCAPSCALAIAAEPTIAVTTPRPPAIFTLEDDCDPGAVGLQILVEGTSDATNGSPVEIVIGTGTPSTPLLANGVFSACVQAPDGDNQTLTASVTDTATGLSSSTSLLVSTNTTPPPAIGAPTVAVTDRRVGSLTLTWASVLDASNDPLVSYHLRCSRTDITSEAIWDAATVIPVTFPPATSAGVAQSQNVSSFRTGQQRFCMVRGQDAYGQLSPLVGTDPTVASVSNPFLRLEYGSVTPVAVDGARISVSALGDINGDGQSDFAYGTENAGVQVFFGGSELDPTPDVSITLPTSQSPAPEFGANVTGLGDINGDTLPDFAVTARALTHPGVSFGGSVFVFFGRPAASPWPTSITVAANPGCGADICFHSSDSVAAFGSAVTSTNFDGAGSADLVIGAQNLTSGATQRVGRLYVILGGAQLAVPSGTVFQIPATTLDGFAFTPTTASRNFGAHVSAVGLGNDTRGDLVVSTTGRFQEGINGEAFYLAGQAHPGSGSGLLSITLPPQAFAIGTPAIFGIAARAVGDVNGDTFGDVWISTNLDPNGVYPVFLGRSSGFSGVSLFGYTNDVVDNEWGFYVAGGFHTELGRLGDIDNNGFDDVMVGSRFIGAAPGTADLFYGDAAAQSRLRSAADVRISSSGNGQMTPGFVGDVTGDGFRDIAILDSGPGLPATRLTVFY